MEAYVVDAHSLIWFITEDDRLSKQAEHLLDLAEKAEVEVLVPTIVLAEITYIAQKRKVQVTINEVLERIEQGDGFAITPFDFAIFQIMLQLPEEWEIHDLIIAATARYYKARLITKDRALQDSSEIETIW
jgi:predicted nucleic acid-binding protein